MMEFLQQTLQGFLLLPSFLSFPNLDLGWARALSCHLQQLRPVPCWCWRSRTDQWCSWRIYKPQYYDHSCNTVITIVGRHREDSGVTCWQQPDDGRTPGQCLRSLRMSQQMILLELVPGGGWSSRWWLGSRDSYKTWLERKIRDKITRELTESCDAQPRWQNW